MDEWYRSPEWSEGVQRDFEHQLARARPGNRAQYLRIKAVALEEAGDRVGASSLLQRIVDDHADTWPEVAFAHERLGDSYRQSGDLARAGAEYRQAMEVSPSLSGTTGELHVKLGEVLLAEDPSQLAEVDQLLAEARQHVTFNTTAFRLNVLEARLAHATGEDERRRHAATAALDLVGAESQFQRHPTVGIVNASPSLLAELQDLASA